MMLTHDLTQVGGLWLKNRVSDTLIPRHMVRDDLSTPMFPLIVDCSGVF